MESLHRSTRATSHHWLPDLLIESVPLMQWFDAQESQK